MIKVALFGLHKLLSNSLAVLEKKGIFPEVVIFPPIDSQFHNLAIEICERNNIPYIRPESVKDEGFFSEMSTYTIDRIVVTGYHQIFPPEILKLARIGCINCHGGLLPEERGPVPYKWAVYERKSKTGVTFHQMTSKIDEGEIYFKKEIILKDDETSETLFTQISDLIAETVPLFFTKLHIHKISANQNFGSKKYPYMGQVPVELATFDLNLPAEELQRRVRAFSPRPGVFVKRDHANILIKKVELNLDLVGSEALIFKAKDKSIAVTEYEIIP